MRCNFKPSRPSEADTQKSETLIVPCVDEDPPNVFDPSRCRLHTNVPLSRSLSLVLGWVRGFTDSAYAMLHRTSTSMFRLVTVSFSLSQRKGIHSAHLFLSLVLGLCSVPCVPCVYRECLREVGVARLCTFAPSVSIATMS